MDNESDNQEAIYCEDVEYRIYCNICDKLCIERFYKNRLKSQTHKINLINHFKKYHLIKSGLYLSSM